MKGALAPREVTRRIHRMTHDPSRMTRVETHASGFGSGAYGGRMRILADSRRLAQPTAPRVHARVRSGVPISISISHASGFGETLGSCSARALPLHVAGTRAVARCNLPPQPVADLQANPVAEGGRERKARQVLDL